MPGKTATAAAFASSEATIATHPMRHVATRFGAAGFARCMVDDGSKWDASHRAKHEARAYTRPLFRLHDFAKECTP
jgi:hypothetical protein